MYYLPSSCLVLFFLFSLFHHLPYVSSKQELGLCEIHFQCGNITAGFPFWGGNRHKDCGHPLLELRCPDNITSLTISNHLYHVLHIDQTSQTLRLSRSELQGSFCNATFTATTLPPQIFELSSTFKNLTVFYLCDPNLSYRSSYTCPGKGPITVSENLDYRKSCHDSFTINVPKSFVLEKKELNLTNIESALREGFEVKLKIDKKACQDCSSHEICGFNNTTQVYCKEASSSACNTLYPLIHGTRHVLELRDLKFIEPDLHPPTYPPTYEVGKPSPGPIATDGFDVEVEYPPLSPYTPFDDGREDGKQSISIWVFLPVGLLLILILFVALLYNHIKRSNDQGQQNIGAVIPNPKLLALIPLKHYTYAQVKKMTKSFAEVVGRGGFGTVYRGTFSDGRMVAVKVLKDLKLKDNSGEDFINEVASMSQTSHVNIVTLLGFCFEGYKRAIIYEFMENGSLDKFLSSKKSSNTDWRELYGIALGVARGLEYLHHGCRTRIVHFDIKPQNVLLDDNLSPKVSDFGLAKLCDRKESIESLLDTRGTIGYIAPEVFSRVYGSVSHKSDVYSYGMLVLEIIGARNKSSTDDTASNTSSVYFPECIYRDLDKADNGKSIETGISSEEDEIAKKMTLVGLWCIQPWPSDRPTMSRVVEMMEGNLDALKVPPRPVMQQIPTATLQESSTFTEDISAYTEVCSINVA